MDNGIELSEANDFLNENNEPFQFEQEVPDEEEQDQVLVTEEIEILPESIRSETQCIMVISYSQLTPDQVMRRDEESPIF